MINFSDIFKNSFVEGGYFGSLSLPQIGLSMGMALVCGIAIFLFYRFFYKGVVYNHNFNVLLVMVCMITCFIIMTISSNIVLSLGMVGALSIVRFRAAVKDPLDVGFLFWAVAAGITAGAGLYLFAAISTLSICLIYAVFSSIHGKKETYLIIVSYDTEQTEEVMALLGKIQYKLRNKTCSKNATELTVEVKANQNSTSIVENLSRLDAVRYATLVQYNGSFEG